VRPLGEVSRVLMSAAAEKPGTVRQLAERTQVGYRVAEYTASRLVERGQLVRLSDRRPAVLAAPPMTPGGEALADAIEALDWLGRSFWETGPCGSDSTSAGEVTR
jgi:hypothetical protein